MQDAAALELLLGLMESTRSEVVEKGPVTVVQGGGGNCPAASQQNAKNEALASPIALPPPEPSSVATRQPQQQQVLAVPPNFDDLMCGPPECPPHQHAPAAVAPAAIVPLSADPSSVAAQQKQGPCVAVPPNFDAPMSAPSVMATSEGCQPPSQLPPVPTIAAPPLEPPRCRQGHVMRRSVKKAQVRCSNCLRLTPADIFYHCHLCRFTMCRGCGLVDSMRSAQQNDDDNNTGPIREKEEGIIGAVVCCCCEGLCDCCDLCSICNCDSDND